jgi:hypothetical protein
MPQDEFIIRLFYNIDEEMGPVKKYADELLYASEVVTLMILFAIKGGKFRAFYRWVKYNHQTSFPKLPEVSRLSRLFLNHQAWCLEFLANPSLLGIIDTYGMELIHPRREGRSELQIGRKGKSNGRWIVGIKVAWLINHRGEIIEWGWAPAHVPDNAFREMATDYRDEMVVFSDSSFHKNDCDPQNMRYCARGAWNDRYLIEDILGRISEVFHSKKVFHRSIQGIHMRIGAIAAALNMLLKMNDYDPSMTWFAL